MLNRVTWGGGGGSESAHGWLGRLSGKGMKVGDGLRGPVESI